MKKIILSLIILGFFACKSETSTKNEGPITVNKEVSEYIFKVSLEAKLMEDDKLELYYIPDFDDVNFNSQDRVAVYVKGSPNYQIIEFKLPEGIIPAKFRIDLGDNVNKFETQIAIKSVDIALDGNNISIDHTIMDNFFQPNSYLDRNNTGYLRKVVDGKYDPFILAKPILNKKITLEL